MTAKSPFDYIKSISLTKQYNLEPSEEKHFPAFIVNKGLSYFADTVLYANQMNLNADLPAKMKYDYLFHSIKRRNRFAKWDKKQKDEDLEVIMKYYKYNSSKAKQLLSILTPQQIKTLKERLNPGGTK